MARYFRRRKFCRFTAENVVEIDYKDLYQAALPVLVRSTNAN